MRVEMQHVYGGEAKHDLETRNFRMWMFIEVMGRSREWDWDLWLVYWQKLSDAEKAGLCARYEIECESGRYV